MKRLFTLLLISFAALSCEMIDEKLDDLLDKRDWVVFAEGTELSVDVPSKQTVLNYKFESTLDWEVKTDAEWLEIDPMSGKAGKDIKIQIKVLHNKDKEARTGYVDLTLSNEESYRITINQAGEDDENDEGTIVDIPNNQIWYTSTDGEVIEPYSGEYNEYAEAITTFGVDIVSNTYKDGKGVIEFEGDVTTIGECAFAYCSSLTSVTIPDSVTTIGYGAFGECSSLTSVTIPDSVTTIGDAAFSGCSSLTSVTIPDSVTTIGDDAFYYCSSLTSVTIGDSVTTIGECAFIYCSSLTSVTIGDSVTTIGDSAFAVCSSLTSVTIPDSVTEIESYAFDYCCSLQEFNGKFASEDGRCLIIDGTLNAFARAGLTEYTIPDSVTTIGSCTFYDCYDLTTVTIPDSVTTIGNQAFNFCRSLTSITIPDSVTTIGNSAFRECSSLTSINIGDSVTTIGYGAFRECSSLTSVTIGDSVTTIGDSAFAVCSSLTNVTIPDSVTTIEDCAFYYCSSLTSVTIGDSVTTIGDSAFVYCSSLTSVYCKATTPPAGSYDMFFANASGRKIYVPMESVEAYKSAEYWKNYADAIVGYNF
ncbi:MAG: leucine-rich repeat protein [Alistipes sp.]|nr:leucine-rich repeat protein [Alistipes sp.]